MRLLLKVGYQNMLFAKDAPVGAIIGALDASVTASDRTGSGIDWQDKLHEHHAAEAEKKFRTIFKQRSAEPTYDEIELIKEDVCDGCKGVFHLHETGCYEICEGFQKSYAEMLAIVSAARTPPAPPTETPKRAGPPFNPPEMQMPWMQGETLAVPVTLTLAKETCETCGTVLIDDCVVCGAPTCCPKCCTETLKPLPPEPEVVTLRVSRELVRQAKDAKDRLVPQGITECHLYRLLSEALAGVEGSES
jgi:hypothetical protein